MQLSYATIKVLTWFPVTAPTTAGLVNPGIVPHVLAIPISMPEYLQK